jgi:hypothetical protein
MRLQAPSSVCTPRFSAQSRSRIPGGLQANLRDVEHHARSVPGITTNFANLANRMDYDTRQVMYYYGARELVRGILRGIDFKMNADQQAEFIRKAFSSEAADVALKETAIHTADNLPNQKVKKALLTEFSKDPTTGSSAKSLLASPCRLVYD